MLMGNSALKIVVMVGAGASYGAGGNFTRPPLGHELYGEVVKAFPKTWGRFTEPWRSHFELNFEQGMSEVWLSGADYVSSLLTDLGRYFARFQLQGPNAGEYTRLLQVLAKHGALEQTVFASLNYEVLLEEALDASGLGGAGFIPVIKPHGSFNYVAAGSSRFRNIHVSGSTHIYDGPIVGVNREDALRSYQNGIPPAMSNFAEGKHSPVGYRALEATRTEFAHAVREASIIVTIGVHPNPADGHIWWPIMESKADVWYVGGTDPEEPYWEVQSVLGDKFHHVAKYFVDAVPRIDEMLLLSKPSCSSKNAQPANDMRPTSLEVGR